MPAPSAYEEYNMKVLFIGGTGNISAACSRLAISRGMELHLLNRGKQPIDIDGAESVVADIKDEAAVIKATYGQEYDAVVNFIAFSAADIERDMRLFAGRCKQYIFISSASVYQKPATTPWIREDTPLVNPHWEYSRKKIEAEDRLNRALREQGFPGVIVRPSLTYDTVIPIPFCWNQYTVVQRMLEGKRVVVHGDGTSLWAVTHSDDFAKGLVGLLGHQQSIGHAFHITTDEILNWDQMYQAIAAAVGVEANIVHLPSELIAKAAPWEEGDLQGDKAVSTIFDNSKIKRFVPDFCATIRFSEGIKRTLAWFDAEASRKVNDPGADGIIEKLLKAYDTAADLLSAK
jgi:nucleoside-diphosphate-sugar epimerase